MSDNETCLHENNKNNTSVFSLSHLFQMLGGSWVKWICSSFGTIFFSTKDGLKEVSMKKPPQREKSSALAQVSVYFLFNFWGFESTNQLVVHKLSRYEARHIISLNILLKQTSDARSQYRFGQMGRVIRPPALTHSHPHPSPHTHTITTAASEIFAFLTGAWRTNGPTDWQTNQLTADKASYRVVCPLLQITPVK